MGGKNTLQFQKVVLEYQSVVEKKITSASVAQGIEQRFPVPCVGGSNPSRRVFGT